MLEAGIIGLPNVGKSTLFNALTKAGALAANYPFATIEPNVGIVSVPDERLQRLAEVHQPKKIIPTAYQFTDIAGLVKGASKGEGLGNQFLSHIREVNAVCHVVRCFELKDVTHVDGSVDPVRDFETIDVPNHQNHRRVQMFHLQVRPKVQEVFQKSQRLACHPPPIHGLS